MHRQTFLTSSKVNLILVTPDDAPVMARWFNDAQVTAYLGRGQHPMTEVSEREFLETLYQNHEKMVFGLWHNADQKLIGVIGLHHLDHINQSAELGITIGETAYWSHGIGTEAISTLLSHAFGRLNLRSVRLRVLGNNPRGQSCYAKCGFVEVGRFPKSVVKDGAWHDEVHMVAYNPMYA